MELGAFDGRRARRVVEVEKEEGMGTSLPRFPMTVGVLVMLFMEGDGKDKGSGVRVQCVVVLRQ